MAENGLYIAPGGIFPTVDDIRAGIVNDSNKGIYSPVQALVILDPIDNPDLIITGGDDIPVPEPAPAPAPESEVTTK